MYKQISFSLLMLYVFVGVAMGQGRSEVQYIFIGHCYQYDSFGKKVDYRLRALDFSPYEGVWLGGDVCSEATLNYSTIQHIDSVFDLRNPETHWSLGNHDARDGNWEWYEEFVGQKTYYTYSSYGTTRVVMNSNILPTDCESLNEQFEMIVSACDSVKAGNNLVLIMHHGLWRHIPSLPNPASYAQSDLRFWNSNCYSMKNNFYQSIYPLLVDAKVRGVNVYCILGDMGAQDKSVDFLSDDGIHFLGCGLYHNEPEDMVLILSVLPESNQLSYQYHNLDSLLLVQP